MKKEHLAGRAGGLAGALGLGTMTILFASAVTLTPPPTVGATTVLGAEAVFQPRGKTQTAFGNAFCRGNVCGSVGNPTWPGPSSVETGADRLGALVAAVGGDIVVMGWSLGATIVYEQVRRWAELPETAPDPSRIRLVTFGNPETRYGSNQQSGVRRGRQGLPADQPYQHLEVVAQYDDVADRPARWGWYSMINLSASRHYAYFDIDLDDPDNLVYQERNTTYLLVKADVLPMLKWRDWFTSDQKMAELDAKYRPLVEQDYDRPAYVPQGPGADWATGAKPEVLRIDPPASEPAPVRQPELEPEPRSVEPSSRRAGIAALSAGGPDEPEPLPGPRHAVRKPAPRIGNTEPANVRPERGTVGASSGAAVAKRDHVPRNGPVRP